MLETQNLHRNQTTLTTSGNPEPLEMFASGTAAGVQKLRDVAECCLKMLHGVTPRLVGAPTTKPTASVFIPECKQYAADVRLELHNNTVYARLVVSGRGRMPVERVYRMGLAQTLCRT